MKSAILPALAGILAAAPALAQPETTAGSIRHIATANREATFRPASSGFIGGAQVYPWSEGTIYIAYTAPGLVTDIVLQPGESLIAMASGDTARWVIGDTTSGSGETKQTHLLVKPFSGGLVTNLVVTTDRRTYHVRLVSTSANALSSMRWTYPQDAIALIAFPPAYSRRIRITVSNTNIPISPPENPGSCLNHRNEGSLLDADHPANGVLFARRSTIGTKASWQLLVENSPS